MITQGSSAAKLGLSVLLVLCACHASLNAQQTPAAGPAATDTYIYALSALVDAGVPAAARPFLTKFPELLLADLSVQPPRREGIEYKNDKSGILKLADNYKLGAALLSRLDDAAGVSLDPSGSFFDRLDKAEKARIALEKARSAFEAPEQKKVVGAKPPVDRVVKAWGDGLQLLELKGETPLRAGRKQGIELVIVGEAAPVGTYVEVKLQGYDTDIGRKVFEWTGYASPGDPAPLAEDFAGRLLAWLAGSPFGRIRIETDPASASLLIDGNPVEARPGIALGFDEAAVAVDAWAPGRSSVHKDLEIKPGEDQEFSIVLPEAKYGSASIVTEPPDANISVEGAELAPGATLPLTGLRSIAVASAPGYEKGTVVVPASGLADLTLKLRPSDGIGPSGRAENAKNDFYGALGLVVIAIPISSLSLGLQSIYGQAELSSGGGLFTTRVNLSAVAFGVSATALAAAVGNAVFRLVLFVQSAGK